MRPALLGALPPCRQMRAWQWQIRQHKLPPSPCALTYPWRVLLQDADGQERLLVLLQLRDHQREQLLHLGKACAAAARRRVEGTKGVPA